MLSVLGLCILIFLVIYFAFLRGSSVPDVPESRQPEAVRPTTPEEPMATPVAPPAPVVATEATLQVSLPRPTPLFIDGELVSKKAKDHTVKMSPGKHRLAIKLGKKNLQTIIEVEPGSSYRARLDQKKKRLTVDRATP